MKIAGGRRSTRILEGSFELLVVNATHLKAVPGRKATFAVAHPSSSSPTTC